MINNKREVVESNMSVTNYSLPFLGSPVSAAYVNLQGYGPVHQAAAINSLLYDTPRYGQRHAPSVSPPSPDRRQSLNPRKNKDHRDPYRNQYPRKTVLNQASSAGSVATTKSDYDDYINDSVNSEEDYRSTYHQVPEPEKLSSSTGNNANRKLGLLSQSSSQQQQGSSRWQANHPPTFKRIANTYNSVPEPGTKTSLHAVIDFDDDFEDYSYDDDDDQRDSVPPSKPQVTPIEGPILIKNGSVPVVPLYSYPVVKNGTLVQIPILWTALSLALGFEIHGEIVRGVPCIKRFHQLFCPTAGSTYPIEKIERFIDDNKALMKRMYGEFQMSAFYGPPAQEIFQGRRHVKRQVPGNGRGAFLGSPPPKGDSIFGGTRSARQSSNKNSQSESTRVDACESKIEIVTPYWASNSAGKIRAIVNTQHFEQAIHQEVCSKVQTKRCVGDCGCEQKYKWHRLLAYDPDNDCKGIFMDWFLFPSCCVCRCAPIFGN